MPHVDPFIDLSADQIADMARPLLNALHEAAAWENVGDPGKADLKLLEAFRALHGLNMALGFAAGRIWGGLSRHRRP